MWKIKQREDFSFPHLSIYFIYKAKLHYVQSSDGKRLYLEISTQHGDDIPTTCVFNGPHGQDCIMTRMFREPHGSQQALMLNKIIHNKDNIYDTSKNKSHDITNSHNINIYIKDPHQESLKLKKFMGKKNVFYKGFPSLFRLLKESPPGIKVEY